MSEAEGRIKPEDADAKRDEKGHFGKGNTMGYAGGRPKGATSLTGILRELLASEVPGAVQEHGVPLTYAQLLVRTAVKHAAQGNASFYKEIAERIDGKVPDRVEAKLGGNWSMEYEPLDENETPEEQEAGDA
jgi:hypothetical protein